MKKVTSKKSLQNFAQQSLNKEQQKKLKGGNDIVVIDDLIIN